MLTERPLRRRFGWPRQRRSELTKYIVRYECSSSMSIGAASGTTIHLCHLYLFWMLQEDNEPENKMDKYIGM